ncbi:MAG: hypothetical protein ACM4D3_22980 [Candidatus Sericytochromatia bacterium]
MPIGDLRRNLQRDAGAVGRLLAGTLLAVERPDEQFDLAGTAKQKEPMGISCDFRRRQAGDDRDDRFGLCHLSAQAVDRLDRQPAAHVRDHLDHVQIGRAGERGAE